jgi:AraC family transcriptional regulator
MEEWSGGTGAGERPEGFGPEHMVTVHVGQPMDATLDWSGGHGKSARFTFGSVNIVPARMPYRCSWTKTHAVLVLQVGPEFVTMIAGGSSRGVLELRPQAAIRDPLLKSLALHMRRDMLHNSPSGQAYGETLALALGAQLVRHHTETQARVRKELSRKAVPSGAFARALEFVDAHFQEDISVSQLAAIADMSPYQFTRAFKAKMGIPPHRYLVERRIAKAKLLLRMTKLPLSQIALEVGFSTPNHFAYVFRRTVGLSATKYRAIAIG